MFWFYNCILYTKVGFLMLNCQKNKNEGHPQNKFHTRPTAIKSFIVWSDCVHDKVMTSHDACTIGTSQVLTVQLLQWLKMEAVIPVPADSEVRSVIKLLNAQSIAPIKIHRQLCQVYGHTLLDGQHISCRSSVGRCLIIIHPSARTLHPVF